MKVRELIKELKKVDGGLEVFVHGGDRYVDSGGTGEQYQCKKFYPIAIVSKQDIKPVMLKGNDVEYFEKDKFAFSGDYEAESSFTGQEREVVHLLYKVRELVHR